MSIDEFRRHNTFPSDWAKELSNNVILNIVLQVLEEHHPVHFTINPDNNGDVSPVKAGIEIGMTRGYTKALDTIRLLAQRKTRAEDIGEPTYSEPLEQTQNAI